MRILAPGTSMPKLRHELSKILAEYRKAHLAEAMAAALGFGSHAALCARIREVGGWSIQPYEVNVEAAVARLSALAGPVQNPRMEDALHRVFHEAAVVVTGPGYFEGLIPVMADYAANGFEHPSERARLSIAINLMTRIMPPWGHAAENHMRDRREHDLPLLLIDHVGASRILDPDMSDLLSISLSTAGETASGEWTPGRSAWIDRIFGSMRSRLDAFLDAVVATLPEDPGRGFLSRPRSSPPRLDPRPGGRRAVGMVDGLGDGRRTFGLSDGGEDASSFQMRALAIHAFAMFARGDPLDDVREFIWPPASCDLESIDEVLVYCMANVPAHPTVGERRLLDAYAAAYGFRGVGDHSFDEDVQVWFTAAAPRRKWSHVVTTRDIALRFRGLVDGLSMREIGKLPYSIAMGAELVYAKDDRGVDPETREKAMEMLIEAARGRVCRVVVETHDPSLAAYEDVLRRHPGLSARATFEVEGANADLLDLVAGSAIPHPAATTPGTTRHG